MPIHTHHPAGTASWLDLSSPDLDVAASFYEAVFGWHIAEGSAEFGGYRTAMQKGQAVAGLVPVGSEQSQPAAWRVYYATEDIQGDAAQISALGGQMMLPPIQVGDLGHMLVAADPTGAVFGLWQAGTFGGAGIKDEHGSLTWSEVMTRDAEQAQQFYRTLLGATVRPLPDMGYFQLLQGDQEVGGVMQMDDGHWPAEVPPHWNLYFRVDSADQVVAAVEAHGGQVITAPFDSPYGRLAVLTDPQGALFSIMQVNQDAAMQEPLNQG